MSQFYDVDDDMVNQCKATVRYHTRYRPISFERHHSITNRTIDNITNVVYNNNSCYRHCSKLHILSPCGFYCCVGPAADPQAYCVPPERGVRGRWSEHRRRRNCRRSKLGGCSWPDEDTCSQHCCAGALD